jgi:hypothetical protein
LNKKENKAILTLQLEKKPIRTPCNRAKLLASGVWDQLKRLYKSAILCGQISY